MNRRHVAVILTAAVWLIVTLVFWVGYTGEDDLMYARYAYLLHRPPMVWWEFRMPAILAIRASFLLFGPTEFAAAVPSLLGSLAILTAVAWFVNWPSTLTWQSQSAVLIAAILPIDVGFRSYPAAHQIAAGLVAMGTVCLLKGGRITRMVGGVLLAFAFITHESMIFYIGFFCAICLAFDHRTYLRPVMFCAATVAVLVTVEALIYQLWLGDAMARWKTSASATALVPPGVDPDVGLSGLAFYLWPLRNVLFSKHFGIDWLLLLICSVIAWPRFSRPQRILLMTTVITFFWLGFGTQVPWTYRPFYRQYHFYNPLALGIAALLPFAIGYALERRARVAFALIGLVLGIHVASLATSGRWGAPVDVARDLLAYANRHGDQTFLTDVNTMNEMYVIGGFRLPVNIICLNGPTVENDLLLNKEPAGIPRYRFQVRPITGVLINREQRDLYGREGEFPSYVAAHGARTTTIVDVRYRLPFAPLSRLVKRRGFMIRSAGAELVTLRNDKEVPASAAAATDP